MSNTVQHNDRITRDMAVVRGIVHRYVAPHQARVFLFGSHATGHAVRSSDIDVAVMASAPLPASVMLNLREALDDANILERVDLIDLCAVEPSFRDRALREGVEWID